MIISLYKKFKSDIVIILIIGLIWLIGGVGFVGGKSMQSSYMDGQIFLFEKISGYNEEIIERNTVVMSRILMKSGDYLPIMKRVIGLPGETIYIDAGKIYINGEVIPDTYSSARKFEAGIASKPFVLKEDEYFLMGDNRNHSTDSRKLGPVKRRDITGTVLFLGVWEKVHISGIKAIAVFVICCLVFRFCDKLDRKNIQRGK